MEFTGRGLVVGGWRGFLSLSDQSGGGKRYGILDLDDLFIILRL
jgi:hypothetical protein